MIIFGNSKIEKIKDYKFYRAKNIFSLKDRSDLIKIIKPKLTYFDNYPVPQTNEYLHKNLDFQKFFPKFEHHINRFVGNRYNIVACWSVFTDGSNAFWHVDKLSDYTLIYYLKNKNPNNGTFIKLDSGDYVIKGHENTLVIHDSKTVHRSPITKNKIERYVISIGISLK
jgi:hypothetical protein